MDGSTWWHPAVLVALLLRLSKLTQTDNCYPSLVHWIDFLLHGFPSQKENKVWVKPKKKARIKRFAAKHCQSFMDQRRPHPSWLLLLINL